ncbi:hypothetical protein AX16_000267 [Volvariella volvacea WC 439]|nr:hypothetical protein AX16_000267 [Volvariella volvacea WC 439]
MPKFKKGNQKVTQSTGQVKEARGPGIKIARVEDENDQIVPPTDPIGTTAAEPASSSHILHGNRKIYDSHGEADLHLTRAQKKAGARVTFQGLETEESASESESDESTLPPLDYVDESKPSQLGFGINNPPQQLPSTFIHPPLSRTAERPPVSTATSSASAAAATLPRHILRSTNMPTHSDSLPPGGHPDELGFGASSRPSRLWGQEEGWGSSRSRHSRSESTKSGTRTQFWSAPITPTTAVPKTTELKGWQSWRKPNDARPPNSVQRHWQDTRPAAPGWNNEQPQHASSKSVDWATSNMPSRAWGVPNNPSSHGARSSVGTWRPPGGSSNIGQDKQQEQGWGGTKEAQSWPLGGAHDTNRGWGIGQASSVDWGNHNGNHWGGEESEESESESESDEDPASQMISTPAGGFKASNVLSSQQRSRALNEFLTDPYSTQPGHSDGMNKRQSHSSRTAPAWSHWVPSREEPPTRNFNEAQQVHSARDSLPDGRPQRPYSSSSRTYAYAINAQVLNQPATSGTIPTTTEGLYLAFTDSNGSAIEQAKGAIFGRSRLARDRIYWTFDPQQDTRVFGLLKSLDMISHHIATYGLHQFLHSGERGALLVNVDFWSRGQPAVDWLTYGQLQKSLDRILQRSVAVYDPAKQVVVFPYLISQSGSSVAIWRHKVNIPESASNRMEQQIKKVVTKLPKLKEYVIHLDELTDSANSSAPPPPKGAAHPTRKLSKAKGLKGSKPDGQAKGKRKWWRLFQN